MSKGYWIAHIDVRDPVAYQGYIEAALPAYREYGATFLVRGGAYEAEECRPGLRIVVIEFESYEVARACYESETYRKAREIRRAHSVGEVFVVRGHEG